MGDILRKIEEIEYEMSKTQKNKATAGHLGMLKAKLAKLRRYKKNLPKSFSPSPTSQGVDHTQVSRRVCSPGEL